jgi:hypothetical protein
MLTADLADEWQLLLTVGLLVALALVLGYRLLHRDRDIARTRYGFFVERDRFDTDEPEWPQLEPPEHQSLPDWTDRTAELPPNLPPEKPG